LQNKPSGAKDGLFVLSIKISPNEKVKQISILPNAPKIKTSPTSGRFEYGNILLFFDEA
jgi:hypothetical protein